MGVIVKVCIVIIIVVVTVVAVVDGSEPKDI